MEELRSAMEEHMEVMADLVQKLSSELRSGLRPAYDNFIGFFHAIDWKHRYYVLHLFKFEGWGGTLVDLLTSIPYCLTNNNNFLKEEYKLPDVFVPSGILGVNKLDKLLKLWNKYHLAVKVGTGERIDVIIIHSCSAAAPLAGVYLAETVNKFLGDNWKRFATQNYFDPSGLFLSVLWSGPLLAIAIIILINTLFSMCYLIVRWKRAELRHRARVARNKQD
ncbi:Transmembrane protein 18 [Corchorus olitorius]|uniref:Transmembrane protein 18 n=1 Tax=Corchorus olitorius TaxID=93759 RepID=A0A1R3GGW3_9ROSI|nr:Transmembrane protein 18 [Corchorus olitorius]